MPILVNLSILIYHLTIFWFNIPCQVFTVLFILIFISEFAIHFLFYFWTFLLITFNSIWMRIASLPIQFIFAYFHFVQIMSKYPSSTDFHFALILNFPLSFSFVINSSTKLILAHLLINSSKYWLNYPILIFYFSS